MILSTLNGRRLEVEQPKLGSASAIPVFAFDAIDDVDELGQAGQAGSGPKANRVPPAWAVRELQLQVARRVVADDAAIEDAHATAKKYRARIVAAVGLEAIEDVRQVLIVASEADLRVDLQP